MPQLLRALIALTGPGFGSQHLSTWQLTTFYNFVSTESGVLFWPPWAPRMQMVCRQNTYRC